MLSGFCVLSSEWHQLHFGQVDLRNGSWVAGGDVLLFD